MWDLFAIVLLINLSPRRHKTPHVPQFIMFHQTSQFTSPISPFTHHHNPIFHPLSYANRAPSTSSHYQPLALCVNVEPQPNIFPIPINNTHVEPSALSIILTLIVPHDQTLQPTPIFPTHLQPPLRAFCPTYGCQFTFQGLTCHQHFYQASNSSYPDLTPFQPNNFLYSQLVGIGMGFGFGITCPWVLPFQLSLSFIIQLHPYCLMT